MRTVFTMVISEVGTPKNSKDDSLKQVTVHNQHTSYLATPESSPNSSAISLVGSSAFAECRCCC
jgi:hypothetical protein